MAEKQWLKVLEINRTIAEPEKKSTILEALIHYYIEHDQLKKALNYMDDLILLVNEYEHPTIINTYNLCKVALMVSESQPDYSEVIKILEQLVSIDVGFREEINFNIRLRAMFNLSHIYLRRLVETGDLSFFENAVTVVDEIITFTQQQRLIPNVIDAKILKAKLKVIESDVDTAISIISTAMKQTEEFDLAYHQDQLKSEFHQLFTDKSTWEGDLNPINIESRVKDSMILHFLRTKGGSKGAFPDF